MADKKDMQKVTEDSSVVTFEDSEEENGNNQDVAGLKWTEYSKTERTCNFKGGNLVKQFKGALKKCIKVASKNPNVKYIWHSKSDWCALFKKCEKKRNGKLRKGNPGITYQLKDGEWKFYSETEKTCGGPGVKTFENKSLKECKKVASKKKYKKVQYVWYVNTIAGGKKKNFCKLIERCDLAKGRMPGYPGVTYKKEKKGSGI